MEKKIKLDSKTSVKLNNSVYWTVIYRNQFGRDIVPTLIPALNAGIDIVMAVYQATGGQMPDKDAIKRIDADALKDALIEASGLEMVDILHVMWSMAKCADEEIPDPDEWLRGFGSFPLDVIGPALFELLYKGFISTKNSQRLQNLFGNLKPESTSTKS